MTRTEAVEIGRVLRRFFAMKGIGDGETIKQEIMANGATRLEFPAPTVVNQVHPAEVTNYCPPSEVPITVNAQPDMSGVEEALIRNTEMAQEMVDTMKRVETLFSEMIVALGGQAKLANVIAEALKQLAKPPAPRKVPTFRLDVDKDGVKRVIAE